MLPRMVLDRTSWCPARCRAFPCAPASNEQLATWLLLAACRSMGVFLRALTTAYNGPKGSTARLPPLPLQYSDYAVWQREWMAGPQADAQRQWWKQNLDGAPALLQLPADFNRPALPTGKGGSVRSELDVATTAAARSFAQKMGCTTYSLFLAVYRRVAGLPEGDGMFVYICLYQTNTNRYEKNNFTFKFYYIIFLFYT